MLKTIDDIFTVAKGKASPKRLVLCNAADPHALEAILRASEMGLVVPILTGCRDEIKRTADVLGMSIEGAEIVPTADIDDTIKTAVSLYKFRARRRAYERRCDHPADNERCAEQGVGASYRPHDIASGYFPDTGVSQTARAYGCGDEYCPFT